MILLCVGEFGIVYRGVLKTDKCIPRAVAVKTLKGIKQIMLRISIILCQ